MRVNDNFHVHRCRGLGRRVTEGHSLTAVRPGKEHNDMSGNGRDRPAPRATGAPFRQSKGRRLLRPRPSFLIRCRPAPQGKYTRTMSRILRKPSALFAPLSRTHHPSPIIHRDDEHPRPNGLMSSESRCEVTLAVTSEHLTYHPSSPKGGCMMLDGDSLPPPHTAPLGPSVEPHDVDVRHPGR